jgi:hypothetical protein
MRELNESGGTVQLACPSHFAPKTPRLTWHSEGSRCCWSSHERRFLVGFNPRNRDDFKEHERIILRDFCDGTTRAFRTVNEAKLAAGRRVLDEWRIEHG